MLPWDFEVWRAMSVPPGVLIPENTIIVSAEGRGVSDMAGGDYDGDIDKDGFATGHGIAKREFIKYTGTFLRDKFEGVGK